MFRSPYAFDRAVDLASGDGIDVVFVRLERYGTCGGIHRQYIRANRSPTATANRFKSSAAAVKKNFNPTIAALLSLTPYRGRGLALRKSGSCGSTLSGRSATLPMKTGAGDGAWHEWGLCRLRFGTIRRRDGDRQGWSPSACVVHHQRRGDWMRCSEEREQVLRLFCVSIGSLDVF